MMHSVYLDDYVDTDGEWQIIAHQPEGPRAPQHEYAKQPELPRPSGYDDNLHGSDSDEDYASQALGDSRPGPKPGGYGGRIEQILYENPQLPILITDAGKGSDGTKYIVYTIRTGVRYQFI